MSKYIELSGVACAWAKPFFYGDEQIACEFGRTAFDEFLLSSAVGDVGLWINHDERLSLPLASPLRLWNGCVGLMFCAKLKRTELSESLELSLICRQFSGCSVSWTTERNKYIPGPIRQIAQGRLHEISLADRPASPGTSVRLTSEPPSGKWPFKYRLDSFLARCQHRGSRTKAEIPRVAKTGGMVSRGKPDPTFEQLKAAGVVRVVNPRAAVRRPLLVY